MESMSHEESLPVYKNMKEDPAYNGEGKTFIDFENKIFGYTIAQKKEGKIIAIGGENGEVPYLHIGDSVVPEGDSRGLVGLEVGQNAEIIEIAEPFVDGRTDQIILVKQGDSAAWLKPYQFKKTYLSNK